MRSPSTERRRAWRSTHGASPGRGRRACTRSPTSTSGTRRCSWPRARRAARRGTPRRRAGTRSSFVVEATGGEARLDLTLAADVLAVQLLSGADVPIFLELTHHVHLAERLVHVLRSL